MKTYFIKSIEVLILTFVLTACMTSQSKKEDEKLSAAIQAQTPANTPEQIMQRASDAFANAEGLSPEQKIKLGTLYSRVYTEGMAIRREIGQSKSLLFSTLAKNNYKNSEIKKLKNRITELNQKHLMIMFDALDEVQNIIGPNQNAEKIYKHIEKYEMPFRVNREITY